MSKSNTAKFYPAHWAADGYGTDESDKFQVEIFRKMFPGYEKIVAENITADNARARVLDVGCGDGTAAAAFFGEVWDKVDYLGLEPSGIKPALDYFARRGMNHLDFRLMQKSMFEPLSFANFDWVFCVGVLHYLPDMAAGLARLTELLRPGGTMVLWVYKKQPPIRELTDNYLRSYFSAMSPENARKAIEGLTKLGIQLDHVDDALRRPMQLDDIPELGIKAGEYTVHEFFYYYIMKLFANPALSFERHVVNNWNAYYPNPVEFIEPGTLHNILTKLRLECELFHEHGNGIGVIAVKCP